MAEIQAYSVNQQPDGATVLVLVLTCGHRLEFTVAMGPVEVLDFFGDTTCPECRT